MYQVQNQHQEIRIISSDLKKNPVIYRAVSSVYQGNWFILNRRAWFILHLILTQTGSSQRVIQEILNK